MRCAQCGSEVAAGMLFCPNCGNALVSQRQQQQVHYQQHNSPQSGFTRYILLSLGISLIFLVGLFFCTIILLVACDGCGENETEYSEQSSDYSVKDESAISLSSINTDALEYRIESKYDLDNVKIIRLEKLRSSPLKILFHFDYDSVQGRIRNVSGVCTFYDDGEIDEVHVTMTLIPSRFYQ